MTGRGAVRDALFGALSGEPDDGEVLYDTEEPRGQPPLLLVANAESGTVERHRTPGEPAAWLNARHLEVSVAAQPLVPDVARTSLPTGHSISPTEYALDAIQTHLDELQARTPIERLLALQILWQHVRISRLCAASANPANSGLAVSSSLDRAVDRALSTFARQCRAFEELRRPDAETASPNELG